jgi:hypothetical protein
MIVSYDDDVSSLCFQTNTRNIMTNHSLIAHLLVGVRRFFLCTSHIRDGARAHTHTRSTHTHLCAHHPLRPSSSSSASRAWRRRAPGSRPRQQRRPFSAFLSSRRQQHHQVWCPSSECLSCHLWHPSLTQSMLICLWFQSALFPKTDCKCHCEQTMIYRTL